MKVLKYKGYVGSVEVSTEDNCLFGKVLFIEPLINYEGETVAELSAAFNDAVDDYLLDCEAASIEPAKPCKGSFNVRTGPELHQAAAIQATQLDLSLNEFVKRAIQNELRA
jgi:predicted HicB family RNase H-like nuclease